MTATEAGFLTLAGLLDIPGHRGRLMPAGGSGRPLLSWADGGGCRGVGTRRHVYARHPPWRTSRRQVIAIASGMFPTLMAGLGVLVAVLMGVTDADP
jgi:hypothetical protein